MGHNVRGGGGVLAHLPDKDKLAATHVVVVEAMSGLHHQQHLTSVQAQQAAVHRLRHLQPLYGTKFQLQAHLQLIYPIQKLNYWF